MHNPKFKLGKKAARRDYRIPRLSKYASLLPAPPPSADWYSAVPKDGWGMLKNDTVGDCLPVAAMHGIYQERVYANRTAVIPPPTDAEALNLYEAAGGYILGDESTDQGMFMLGNGGLMPYWQKTGIMCDGVLNKPTAFVQITQPSPVEWQQAIAIIGSLLTGLQLPEAIVSGDEPPDIWANYRGPVAGGHEIILVGYEKVGRSVLFDLISWGKKYRATQQFLQHCMDEAVAVANSAFINATGVDPGGLTLAALVADLPSLA